MCVHTLIILRNQGWHVEAQHFYKISNLRLKCFLTVVKFQHLIFLNVFHFKAPTFLKII